MESKRIVVYGGTGYYGRKIIECLISKNQHVRVVSRDFSHAKRIVGDRVDIYQGDVTNYSCISESMKDMDVVIICLSAMKPRLIRKMKQIECDAVLSIISEAEKNKVSRIIYLSGYEIREDLLSELRIPEFGAHKLLIESRIKKSNLNWTILGCAPAFEIFFAFVRKGKMTVPGGGEKAIPSIAAIDVGEICAQVALRSDLNKARIKLTGPEAINFATFADRYSSLSGNPLKFMKIPLIIVNIVSFIALPFFPFLRYLYKSLLMLNNFPEDLALDVPKDHNYLTELFDYKPTTIEHEIRLRIGLENVL